jgi:hypothetical protein
MVSLKDRDAWPLLLSHKPRDFDSYSDNDPYVAALHDIFHILALSRYSRETREFITRVLHLLMEMGMSIEEGDRSDPVIQVLFEARFRDPQVIYQEIFDVVKKAFKDRSFLLDLQNKIQNKLPEDPEAEKLLSVFKSELSRISEFNYEVALGRMNELQEEWVGLMKAHGIEPRRYDLRKVFAKLDAEGRLPDGLRRWLKENPQQALEAPELVLPQDSYENLKDTDREFYKHLMVFQGLAMLFPKGVGLPEELLFYQKDGGYHFRFLPNELMMNLFRIVHGANAVQRQITPDATSPEMMRNMFRRDERPFWITQKAQDVEGAKQVPGYLVAFHEGYHLNILSEIPRETRQAVSAVVEVVTEMGLSLVNERSLGEMVDGHVDKNDSLLTKVFDTLAFYPLGNISASQEFYRKLQNRLEGHPRKPEILENYRKVFADHFEIMEATSMDTHGSDI